MTTAVLDPPAKLPWEDRALQWAIATLVVAQAAVVGLQVIGRHVFRQPIPWTEEIARLLLAWLMSVGGISALRHAQHPRVTALLRLFPDERRAAVEQGLRLVLLAFFLSLVIPAWHLTVASAGERLPASGLSGAAISGVLPVALLLMSAVVVQQLRRDGFAAWQDRTSLLWALGAAGLSLASVLVPLVAGAAPLVVLIAGFLVTAALGVPLAFTLALTSLTYLLGIGGVSLIILPIKILGGVDSFVLLAIPLFIVAGGLMEAGGISERTVTFAMAIVGRVRGGLAMVAVVAEILFSGISGSTTADVSAISSLLVPSMRRAGYSGAESVSIVAAASAMGILVPPCLTMVVLGSLVNLSIVTLFLAGFLPAFVLAVSLWYSSRYARGARTGRSAPRSLETTSGVPRGGQLCPPACQSCCSAESSQASRRSRKPRCWLSCTRSWPALPWEASGARRLSASSHRAGSSRPPRCGCWLPLPRLPGFSSVNGCRKCSASGFAAPVPDAWSSWP